LKTLIGESFKEQVLSPSREEWRFVDSGYHDGASNMAIDKTLAEQIANGEALPTLRVYGWYPPAISMGFHQTLQAVDLARCQHDAIDVVVRPTGGRAILHSEELTYCVVLPTSSRYYSTQTRTVYQTISLCLVAALQLLNIDAVFTRATMSPNHFSRGEISSMCYASSIQYEIEHKGRKLIGSAQRHFTGSLLQHGSILIGRDHLRLPDYLALQDETRRAVIRRYLDEHTVCLNDLTAAPVSYHRLSEAVKKGFEKCLDIRFVE
jgi:lipoate-protein ligase A